MPNGLSSWKSGLQNGVTGKWSVLGYKILRNGVMIVERLHRLVLVSRACPPDRIRIMLPVNPC
jgi:hypothetical protein